MSSSATKTDSKTGESLNFTISKTWDGQIPEEESEINIRLFPQKEKVLVIQVDAPFYNDPPLLSPPGSTPKLWDYEVVEVFFLGEHEKYLEVELAPKGQYLLLQLNGVRNITREGLPLDHYVAEIRRNRWFGEAHIPLSYFPPKVGRMNAYCIYKSEPARVYMSLFPATGDYNTNARTGKGESCEHEYPDFHRLQYFQPIDLPGLCNSDVKDNFP